MATQSKLPNVEKVKAVQHTFIIHRLLKALTLQSLILKEKIILRTQKWPHINPLL